MKLLIAMKPDTDSVEIETKLLSLYGPWPYGSGSMAPYSCFKNFGKLTRYHIFLFGNQKGISKFCLVLKQAPLLIKYPTLKVRERTAGPTLLPPHKNFDSLLGRIA